MCDPDSQNEKSRKSWSYQTTRYLQFNTNYAKPKPLKMKGKKEAYYNDYDRWMKRGLKHHQKTYLHVKL